MGNNPVPFFCDTKGVGGVRVYARACVRAYKYTHTHYKLIICKNRFLDGVIKSDVKLKHRVYE